MQLPGHREQADELLVMGRITAPYGVRGWVRVIPYTETVESLLDYLPWHVRWQGGWREMQPAEGRPHGKGLVVRLQGCGDRDAATALAGCDVAVSRSQLPEAGDNEYYWHDLIGLQVMTVDGQQLGRVDHLLETGANDVLVVRGDRERLVPFIQDQVVCAVDLERGEIRVDWDPEF